MFQGRTATKADCTPPQGRPAAERAALWEAAGVQTETLGFPARRRQPSRASLTRARHTLCSELRGAPGWGQ